MSANGEDVTSGGHNGPSGSGHAGEEGLIAFVRHIGERVVDISGDLTPEAALQIDQSKGEGRMELAREIVANLPPRGVPAGLWQRWLAGGRGRFGEEGLASLSSWTMASRWSLPCPALKPSRVAGTK